MAQKLSPETSSDFVETFSNIGSGNSSPDWRDTKTVSECVGHLCLSPHLSDVTLKFSKEPSVKLHAHKFVLGMRSRVFEAMLYGKQGVTDNTVIIDDIGSKTMQELIRFIYSDKAEINGENVLQILHAAKLYSVAGLAAKCSKYLEESINAGNVCTIHEQAIQYSMKKLQTKCLNYMLKNANDVFNSGGFLKISKSTLVGLLQSDDLAVNEETIFTAASSWAEAQCISNKMSASPDNKRTVLGEALYQIRFPIMTIENFAKLVTPTKILTSDEEIMLYQYLASKGTTQLSKFVARKRSRNIVTIDLSKFVHQRNFGDSYQGYSLGILSTSSESKVQAISCTFADDVKRVYKSSSSNKAIQFMVEADQLFFDPPIPINYQETIVFDASDDFFPFIRRNESSEANFKAKFLDTDIRITSVPEGLTSISFVK